MTLWMLIPIMLFGGWFGWWLARKGIKIDKADDGVLVSLRTERDRLQKFIKEQREGREALEKKQAERRQKRE